MTIDQLSCVNLSTESNIQGFINRVKKQALIKLSTEQLTTVCIHVRRGDYVKLSKLEPKTTSPEEIKFAMKFMEEKLKYVNFYYYI